MLSSRALWLLLMGALALHSKWHCLCPACRCFLAGTQLLAHSAEHVLLLQSEDAPCTPVSSRAQGEGKLDCTPQESCSDTVATKEEHATRDVLMQQPASLQPGRGHNSLSLSLWHRSQQRQRRPPQAHMEAAQAAVCQQRRLTFLQLAHYHATAAGSMPAAAEQVDEQLPGRQLSGPGAAAGHRTLSWRGCWSRCWIGEGSSPAV